MTQQSWKVEISSLRLTCAEISAPPLLAITWTSYSVSSHIKDIFISHRSTLRIKDDAHRLIDVGPSMYVPFDKWKQKRKWRPKEIRTHQLKSLRGKWMKQSNKDWRWLWEGKQGAHASSKDDSCYSAPDTVLRMSNFVMLSGGQKTQTYIEFLIFKNIIAWIK